MDAAVTINSRLGLISEATLAGRLLDEPELWRMGPEKVMAISAGVVAASIAVATELTEAVLDPARLPHAGLAITRAAIAPARKTLRANARRLAKRQSK